jgi:phosphoglycerol transferase MdoB-like AlkP superfamily enzyme
LYSYVGTSEFIAYWKIMTIRKLPGAVMLFLFTACVNLAMFTLLRAAFWGAFNSPSDPLPGGVLLKSLYIGFKFDLRLALLINLPVLMFSWIRYIDPSRARPWRWLWSAYLLLVNLAVLFFYTVDFAHYAYLQSRLNITAVRFLHDLMISLQWVWETYPVVWGLLGLALLLVMFGYATSRVISRLSRGQRPAPGRWKNALAFSVVSVLVLLGIYGKLSYYPLRWSDAFFSTHPFSSSLAVNPVLFFFDTMGKREKPYDVEATRSHYGMVARYLGVTGPDAETLDFSRGAGPGRGSMPNIIVVLLESYAFHKTGMSGNPLRPTPRFDAVAKDSLLFRRFYVPSAGTARSVFSFVTGIPDVETRETSSRNPLIVEQHTILNAFEGYEKYYFLGGSANWANIRGLLARNIPGLKIYEEGSYSPLRGGQQNSGGCPEALLCYNPHLRKPQALHHT